MKTEIKEIYKCDHCNKLYQVKNACIKHELICTFNLNNLRDCFDCANVGKKEAVIIKNGQKDAAILLYCKVKKHFIHPPKVELLNKSFELPKEEGLNLPMPKVGECSRKGEYTPSEEDEFPWESL